MTYILAWLIYGTHACMERIFKYNKMAAEKGKLGSVKIVTFEFGYTGSPYTLE